MSFEHFNPAVWKTAFARSVNQTGTFASLLKTGNNDVIDILGQSIDIDGTMFYVNQARYFKSRMEDVDSVQSNPRQLNIMAGMVASNIRDTVDSYIIDLLSKMDKSDCEIFGEGVQSCLIKLGEILTSNGTP